MSNNTKIMIIVVSSVVLVMLFAFCWILESLEIEPPVRVPDTTALTGETPVPATTAEDNTAPEKETVTQPTESVSVTPPITQPPVTYPEITEPPVTPDPSVTEPPTSLPPETVPPTTEDPFQNATPWG